MESREVVDGKGGVVEAIFHDGNRGASIARRCCEGEGWSRVLEDIAECIGIDFGCGMFLQYLADLFGEALL